MRIEVEKKPGEKGEEKPGCRRACNKWKSKREEGTIGGEVRSFIYKFIKSLNVMTTCINK